MKKPILLLALGLAAVVAALHAQVTIPLDESVTVPTQVTVTQNVTVSSVPLAAINFDLVNEKITFRMGGNSTSSNGTVTLTGAEYDAVKAAFLTPFASTIAPTLRLKIQQQAGQ